MSPPIRERIEFTFGNKVDKQIIKYGMASLVTTNLTLCMKDGSGSRAGFY